MHAIARAGGLPSGPPFSPFSRGCARVVDAINPQLACEVNPCVEGSGGAAELKPAATLPPGLPASVWDAGGDRCV